MKIKAIRNEVKTFKPVTISITVETQEELDNLRRLSACDRSVPDFVKSRISATNDSVLNYFLQDLNNSLNKIGD